jgi:alkanesulfonate monooxygenase SsuD/methylene tetrahydromethanopterin reductase-like flavin-dependent oxidoreductase (luciferase family)
MPAYVSGLVDHWRESAEDEVERELVRRIDSGVEVPPEEIADARLLWGTPDDVIAQIQRYQTETGCEHIHAAFGAGLPANSTATSHLGSFDQIAAMIRLFGQEVISAFG